MIEASKDLQQTPGSNVTAKSITMKLPTMLENNMFANEFLNWMSSPAGSGRGKNYAEQIVSRVLKILCILHRRYGIRRRTREQLC